MRIPKKILIGVATILVAAAGLVTVLSATGLDTTAMTVTSRQDCGYTDTIVDCGTRTTSELLDVYDKNNDRRGNRDIQTIFHHYGVKRSDITGATSTVKKGWLNTNGTIVVDNAVVANGAQSLYRVHPGKQVSPVNIGGKTYYIGPVAGNYGLGADLFVFFNKDGTFRTAIQASCGNPIVATNKVTPPPTPKPKAEYVCESLVATRIKESDPMSYRFTAKASAKNATIQSYTFNFGDGTSATTTSTVNHTYKTPGTYPATVVVNVLADGKAVKTAVSEKCSVKIVIPQPPKAIYACESLKVDKITDRVKVDFTATASASNATIKSYTFNFGDGKSEVVNTPAKTAKVSHTYADTPKSYTAEVIVTMSDGSIAKRTDACKVPVVIKDKPVEKKPSIDIIKTVNGKEHAKVAVNTEFTYEITVRNTGNVDLKNAVVTDNAPSEVTLISASAGKINGNKWTHTIPELKVGGSAKFVIKAKYAKYSKGTHKNTVCVDTPTVPGSPDDCDDATTETSEKIEVCDLTTNMIITIESSEFNESTMTKDLTQCDDMKVCIIETKTITTIKKNEFDESTMTTDLSKCEVTPEVPVELPKTGLDTFIGGGLGIGSLTAAGYYWSASRRNLLNALLKK